MSPRLPPLRGLEAFLVAARTLSFKQTAHTLAITPSAVSRRIQALEDDLGLALFERGNRSLALSPAGQALLARVEPAFEALVEATQAVRRDVRKTLVVTARPTFAANWLLPRLAEFQARHPGIDVTIETRPPSFDRLGRDLDLAVLLDVDRPPHAEAVCTPLPAMQVFPVCGPSLLAAPVADPMDLAALPLLDFSDLPDGWEAYFRALGLALPAEANRRRFDNTQLLYEAAAGGLGVALGLDRVIQPLLADGRLIRACDCALPSPVNYIAVHHHTAPPPVRRLCTWLVEAFGP
ncbi:MAG: LysR substrate-binding domain-containing protein [Rhodothalassiaceae bacterium]